MRSVTSLVPKGATTKSEYLPPVNTTANFLSNNYVEDLFQSRRTMTASARRRKQQRRPTICTATCVTVWIPGNGASISTRTTPSHASAKKTKGPAW